MDQIIINVIGVLVTAVVLPIITVLGKVLIDFINSKVSNTAVNTVLSQALNIVTIAVKSTMQTYVDTLKKEGRFDEEAQKIALNMAKENALKLFSSDMREFIETEYGNVDHWLETSIESTINTLK